MSRPNRSISRVTSSPGSRYRPERLLADLEQAPAADGPAAQELARSQSDVSGGARGHLPERVHGARPGPARGLDRPAVVRADRRDHLEVGARRAGRPAVRQLVRRHQPRPDRHREVLALRGAEPEHALVALQVARGPVVDDEVAADRVLAALLGEVRGRRVDERPDLQLVVELHGAARRPDRVARPAQLGHVGEVEDRQAVPGLGDLLAASLPHRPHVPLEGVEVAERGRAEDRRAEGEITGVEDGIVVRALRAGHEALDEVREGLDPQPARQVVVEGRHGLAVEHRIVREVRVGRDRAAAGDLEIDPPRAPGIERRRESPCGACGGVSFTDVCEAHRPSLASDAAGPDRLRRIGRLPRPAAGSGGLAT